jgi:transcriptional regulator with XRE-family HTH domain
MSPEYFGANLRKVLRSIDMSQAEFAERSGLTPAAVSQILNGQREPTLKTICKILEVLPTNFNWLVLNWLVRKP